MARPTFTPVFEETEETIKDRMIGRVGEEWRKEPGDFIYDAVAPSPAEVKDLEINQDYILKNSFAQYAEGEYLDLKLYERGLVRGAATPNKRTLTVTADAGVVIPKDHTLSVVILDDNGNPVEYTVDAAVTWVGAGDHTVAITCKTAGTVGNVANGSEFILLPTIPGVRVIVDDGTTIPGADTESDEAAYARYEFALSNPDTGGNKSDYVRWATQVTGVGKAKCIARWDGNGTVKVVVVGADYLPASTELVAEVQEYIDPDAAGLGEGKAPCGAAATVVAATNLAINVTATVSYYAGAEAAAQAAFNAALTAYLQSIAFVEIEGDAGHNNVPVSIAKIGALLITTEGVSNYSGLTLNGGTIDIPVPTQSVATKGVVTI